MGRAPCCDKANVKKGPWSPEEDAKLKEYIEKNGTGGNWIALPQKVGLKRCGKSCRLRWLNYLRPNIKHGEFSEAEDRIICSLYATIGSRWSIIASQLSGRTDNDIKNYWNTKLKKKMMTMNHPSSPQRKQPQQVTLLSMFQNSTSSSSPSSLPLSFRESSNNNSSYYHSLQCSNNFNVSGSYSSYSSSLLSGNSNNNSANSNFQTQESYMCHTQNSIFVFGGEATTSCSSSDGSCNNNNQMNNNQIIEPEVGDGTFVDQVSVANYLYSDGVKDTQNLMQSNFNNASGSVISGWTEKQSGLIWGENPMDYYGLEEIKELISSTSTCNNFLFDQNKTEENVLYY